MQLFREGGQEEDREQRRKAVVWFKRFRDDVIGIFRGSRELFKVFFDTLNKVDPSISFTFKLDEGEGVNFLDLMVTIDDQGFLQTDIYYKLNVKNQLLLPSSCHPQRTTRNSVYSLGLRIRRNVSNPNKGRSTFPGACPKAKEQRVQ